MGDFERELRDLRRRKEEEEQTKKLALEKENARVAQEAESRRKEKEDRLEQLARSVDHFVNPLLRDLASATWDKGGSSDREGTVWSVKERTKNHVVPRTYELYIDDERKCFSVSGVGSTQSLDERELKELLKKAFERGPANPYFPPNEGMYRGG